ncbi:modifier protein of major autolysin LytC [Listeria grandensis FSL F6-0971]|uniref:Modifier protein of major autolysin LytC n=1 Tax=Listeria grandensis FSL F6-0971 TaxID=1265819 RepID=W7BPP7_9LIST|nr:Ig-like domain-containing protein [Listeria grandensis]EUJ25081.1 modifier protein of major autolysin LytC [Listeria grandensis FSL F6-0971]
MKKNMKKIAIALLATNVIASTVLTALPPVETHAAENKLSANLKATQASVMNLLKWNLDQVSGTIPGGGNQQVRLTVTDYTSSNPVTKSTKFTTADASGNYSFGTGAGSMQPNGLWANGMGFLVATVEGANGVTASRVLDAEAVEGHLDTYRTDDTKISGKIDDPTYYNTWVSVQFINIDSQDRYAVKSQTGTVLADAQGNFSVPVNKSAINETRIVRVIAGLSGNILLKGFKNVVVAPVVSYTPTALNLGQTQIDAVEGATGTITSSITPAQAVQQVTYASSNTNVITVDATGKWTAVASGSASITVTPVGNTSLAKTIPVTVTSSAVVIARTSVNDLFIGDNPANHIKDTTTQAKIDAAQTKVDAVTDTTKKAELQTYVDKAQTELDAKNTAKASVDALFSDAPTNTKLKPSTTQAMINDASAEVNALPASADKTAMQADITKANTLFEAITPTTLSDLTTESTTLSGFGEPNSAIVIKNGDTQIASGSVSSNGTYLFNITKLAAGSTITATVTKASNGKTSSASKTVQDTSIVTTKIDAMTVASTTVSGTGEPNATIVIKNGSTQIASGSTAGDGKFLFFVTPQAGGSTITATVTKTSNGKISSASTTVVDDAIVSTTMGALTTDSTSVTGVGEPNSAIVIKNGSTQIASGSTAGDGKYLFYVTPQAAGSTITATVTKASNGKTSSASQVVADSGIAPTKMDALTSNSTTITGTGEPNATIVIKKRRHANRFW